MNLRVFTDQMANRVEVPFPPQRIVSVVPSQTELLADLGLGPRVVGITKFCIHPASWTKLKTIAGGTKKLNLDLIDFLKPDLIIGNKEENSRKDMERLKEKFPVWLSNVITVEDAISMIQDVGALTGTEDRATELADQIVHTFKTIKRNRPQKALYLIWKKPWMAAGRDTFIHSMLEVAGLINVIDQPRYPELTGAEIRRLDPDVILLSSEPYPFTEKHKEYLSGIMPGAKIILTDGEVFSWYGSRMLKFAEYINRLAPQLQ